MSDTNITKTISVAGTNRTLNVRRDTPDIRDRMYEPALIPLQQEVDNRKPSSVLDQKTEGVLHRTWPSCRD